MYAMRPEIRKLLDTAKAIEGLARNAGTHAAGVVISAGPLIDYAPLVRFNDGGVNTQFDMEWVEKIGLLKMDFLGLRNLTVMDRAVKEIRRTVDGTFDLAKISIDDAKTYDMLGHGDTMGVFQLESEGMKRVCTRAQAVALRGYHRARRALPSGPDGLDSAVHRDQTRPREAEVPASQARADSGRDVFGSPATKNRSCRSRATSPVLRMGEADELRKVMGKKQKDKIPVYSEKFIKGAVATSAVDAAARGGDLCVRRAVRGIRLQQVARGRVRMDRLSDGVPESQSSAAVPRRR